MKSMTGYGHYEFSNEYFVITTEIKAYNNRYLDISYSAPPYLSFYELQAINKIKEKIQREEATTLDTTYKELKLFGDDNKE